MSIVIRRSSNYDLLKSLHKTIFGNTAPLYDFTKGYWWIAWEGKVAVGFCGLTHARSRPDTGYLARVGVLQEHRCKGLHKRFIRVRERHARRINLTHIITDTTSYNIRSFNNLIKAGYRIYEPEERWALTVSAYLEKEL